MAFNINPASTQVKYPFNGHLNPNEVEKCFLGE